MYCQVIVDIAHEDVDRVFIYRIPEGLTLEVGMRVHVPFGNRKSIEGIVVEITDSCDLPEARIKDVKEALEDYPAVLPELIGIAQYIKAHSFCTLTQALRLMYPAQMRGQRIHEKKQQAVQLLLNEEKTYTEALEKQKRAPRRYAILEELHGTENGEMLVSELCERLGNCRDALRNLEKSQYVSVYEKELQRKPYTEIESLSAKDPVLTEQQQSVLEKIIPAIDNGKGQFLLYGVTGSGKTEVFIRAVRHTARQGKTAIVLVPEIALTPQMVSWFRSRFGEDAAVLHSRLSIGERYDEWRRIRRGEVHVVIGARSAIFAPLSNIGLIIVDEEHEQSYSSDRTPQYDARVIGQQRCLRSRAVLLLASATPSMRSFALAGRGDYTLLEMPERVKGRSLPDVHIIDMRKELSMGNKSVFSGQLLTGLTRCIERGKQAILFVNRRGYATFVSCRNCGYVVHCEHCDVTMTFHSVGNVLRCHYCGQEMPVPEICPECGSTHIKYFGVGTQRVEDEVHKYFPGVATLRMDNDTTQQKDAHAILLERFRRHEAQVMIGTQMIAKGLDFPDVTMVGIVAADAMLNLPDYRAAERTFQLLTQVAGRAGRAETKGEVFLQTYAPEHYSIQTASRQDYRAFYESEMARRRQTKYPPFTVIVRNVYESLDENKVHEAAQSGFDLIQTFFDRRAYLQKYIIYLRVMPCPIYRIQDKYRWEVLLSIVDLPVCEEAIGKMSEIAGIPVDSVASVCQINPSGLM
ncbi:MAG: primosomal protein N' [Clostridia bacterium]|nr:primosomal protein N' [Clostridia bacterium]